MFVGFEEFGSETQKHEGYPRMKKTSSATLILLAVSFSAWTFSDEGPKRSEGESESRAGANDDPNKNPLNRPPRLLTVIWSKGIGKGEEVKGGKLLPNRVYTRWEPRLVTTDDKTGKDIWGGRGYDITDADGKFVETDQAGQKEKIRRLYGPGTVVYGEFLGDETGKPLSKRYKLMETGETLKERWLPTDEKPKKVYKQFVPKGRDIVTTEDPCSKPSAIDRQ